MRCQREVRNKTLDSDKIRERFESIYWGETELLVLTHKRFENVCVWSEIKVLGKGVEREFWDIFERESQKRNTFLKKWELIDCEQFQERIQFNLVLWKSKYPMWKGLSFYVVILIQELILDIFMGEVDIIKKITMH